ncbi:UNVERIFIED_CONTAM: hypothetical protein GTU68_000432 [Idotea baltica]|nr:hypothetical protein [Idotea baltica]
MVSAVTEGVKVSVEVFYQPEYSHPLKGEYIFNYRVKIENFSPNTLRLMRRHWFIFDSNGIAQEVEGDGVVGKQPIIEPAQSHAYISGCHLNSEMGRMSGYYEMQRVSDGAPMRIEIPAFNLIAPFKLN